MIEVVHLHEFAADQSGDFLKGSAVDTIDQISIDSRKIQNGTQTLFVALEGTQNSGWHFAKDAFQKRVRNFILPREANTPEMLHNLEGANIFFAPLLWMPYKPFRGSIGKDLQVRW